jgi:hypothetical protein
VPGFRPDRRGHRAPAPGRETAAGTAFSAGDRCSRANDHGSSIVPIDPFELESRKRAVSGTASRGPVSGNAGKKVSAGVTGLTPSTTYHFHVAFREGGTSPTQPPRRESRRVTGRGRAAPLARLSERLGLRLPACQGTLRRPSRRRAGRADVARSSDLS